jgi:hypothetical protein
MAIAPPPAVGSPRPWYCKNALDPARRAMSYSPLTEFFLPLNDHPPPAGRRSDSPPLEAILPPFSSPIVESVAAASSAAAASRAASAEAARQQRGGSEQRRDGICSVVLAAGAQWQRWQSG